MEEVLHANIFFFITAITVVCIGVGVLVALYYLVCILRDIRAVSSNARVASEALSGDLEKLRHHVKRKGEQAKNILDLGVEYLTHKFTTRPRATRKKADVPNDL